MRFTASRSIGRLALAAGLTLAGAALVGCQSAARQSDAFGNGADRPPTPRTLHMMAKLINENGRVDQAEFVLQRVIETTPQYLPAYVELADIYIEGGRYEDARDILRLAHNVAPTDAVIANNLGVLLLREGSFAEASSAFRAAVTQDPTEARYFANLAVTLAMQGDFDGAFEAWAAVLPPEEVFWNLGVVAEARGDAKTAGLYFTTANRIRKGGPADEFNPEFDGSQTATFSVPVE